MQENNGIRMALSPVQLAAVLADKSVSEGETLSNRLWGGLGLANGLVEMFGAGVMCIAPEPTMLTKIGCVIVGTHSLDTMQASFRQVWTGRQVSTDTYNSVVSLAESLGSDHQTAVERWNDSGSCDSYGICADNGCYPRCFYTWRTDKTG